VALLSGPAEGADQLLVTTANDLTEVGSLQLLSLWEIFLSCINLFFSVSFSVAPPFLLTTTKVTVDLQLRPLFCVLSPRHMAALLQTANTYLQAHVPDSTSSSTSSPSSSPIKVNTSHRITYCDLNVV
jgi:hypothetical protein